ncbi:uncharacterized protein LOC125370130 [Ricinus communis]|uniref:uncharacterized protein LOC125370130 n=1 Tax=Ricinus communis TaxID=3988 RepID=UPI00201B23D4|nr:uncharacterized protein LOC125370130 [Ricinus communis]
MASSLSSSCYTALIKPSLKLSVTRRPALQVRAQRFRDEGRSPSDIVEANLSVLKERIQEVKMKERLERCCRCEHGWNYASGYNYKLKKQAELSQFFDLLTLVFGTFGFTCLSGTFVLCMFSLLAHLNLIDLL